jgi:hypothetical protein
MTKFARCDICPNFYTKKKRHQKYCSRDCYAKAWPVNNREKHNMRVRQRRLSQPEWYAQKEPTYSKTYRAKLLSSRPWGYLLISARNRAKEKGWPYELTDNWAKERWTGCCEITGLPFKVNGKKGPHPFSPSVDRKDSSLGYTQENTRFILWGCNAIKGVGSDADMYKIAEALVNTAAHSQHGAAVLALPT